jgi:cytochrome c oxidase assembly protein subunit 15
MQLVVGAYMRHTYSGLAVPDFPTMGGSFIPLFDSSMVAHINEQLRAMGQWTVSIEQIYIHVAHRVGGVVVALYTACFYVWAIRGKKLSARLSRHVNYLLALVFIQFGLGVVALLTGKEPFLTSVHVIGGAVLLMLYVLFIVRNEHGAAA